MRDDFHLLSVIEVNRETRDSVSIALDVPPALRNEFSYQPGQFLIIQLELADRRILRCYSLCSSPHDPEPLRIAVKRVNDGVASNALCGNLKAGDQLAVQRPAGRFIPKSLDEDLLLIAGGSGITPILSILKAALVKGRGAITLIYANRDEQSVIFRDVLSDLVARHAERLCVIHWLESVQGLPSTDKIRGLLAPFALRDVFICGPDPFMSAAQEALALVGARPDCVHLERFASLIDADVAASPLVEGAPIEAVLQVAIDGDEHVLKWHGGGTMLDAMLAAGLDVPYSCRVGGCSTCMCRLIAGETQMAINTILTKEEIAEGWVLSCQARAITRRVVIEVP